jgi:hypothetical protein
VAVTATPSGVEELILINSGSSKDRAKSALGEITRMIGNSCSRTGHLIPPDLVASLGLTVEGEAKSLQLPHHIGIFEPSKPPHLSGNAYWNIQPDLGWVHCLEFRRERIAMLNVRLDKLARDILGNFGALSDRTALSHQPRKIVTGGDVSAFG